MLIISMSKTDMLSRISFLVFKFSILLVLIPDPAYAYIDPGSASLIVSSVLGFIAAIGYTFRKYFFKLRGLLKGKKSKDDTVDS